MQQGERMVKESRLSIRKARGSLIVTLTEGVPGRDCGAIIERIQIHMDRCGIARDGAWESGKKD